MADLYLIIVFVALAFILLLGLAMWFEAKNEDARKASQARFEQQQILNARESMKFVP